MCSADGHKQYAVIMHALLHAVGEGQFWISLVKSIQICHDILWLSWSFNACSTGADLSKGGTSNEARKLYRVNSTNDAMDDE